VYALSLSIFDHLFLSIGEGGDDPWTVFGGLACIVKSGYWNSFKFDDYIWVYIFWAVDEVELQGGANPTAESSGPSDRSLSSPDQRTIGDNMNPSKLLFQ